MLGAMCVFSTVSIVRAIDVRRDDNDPVGRTTARTDRPRTRIIIYLPRMHNLFLACSLGGHCIPFESGIDFDPFPSAPAPEFVIYLSVNSNMREPSWNSAGNLVNWMVRQPQLVLHCSTV